MTKKQAYEMLATKMGKVLYPHGTMINVFAGYVRGLDGKPWADYPYHTVLRKHDGQVGWIELKEFPVPHVVIGPKEDMKHE